MSRAYWGTSFWDYRSWCCAVGYEGLVFDEGVGLGHKRV